MSLIEKSIDINVPVKTAYNQWTQFEEFTKFMEGVKEVQQLDDEHLRLSAAKKNGMRKSPNKFRINVLPGRALMERGPAVQSHSIAYQTQRPK